MSNLKNTLSQLESKLQSLVEDNLSRIFSAHDQTKDLSDQLVAAVKSGIKSEPNGDLIAPNLFIIHLSPSWEEYYKDNENVLDQLAESIQEAANQLELRFISPPVIRIIANRDLVDTTQVTARISMADLAQTNTMLQSSALDSPIIPVNAFLIVKGSQVFALDSTVINIGRRSDNHLVIDDARVSRVHAQIRLIKGKFVIFDLDSLGGIHVNNQRINQAVLYPGDVISLAGVPLVYGQESPDLGETQKLNSSLDG